jgi:hypothetical protein
MKKLLIIFCLNCVAPPLFAQVKKLLALPITDYVVKGKDSVQIVQVKLPEGLTIADNTAGVLRSLYSSTDTVVYDLGKGKCGLTKGAYNYYGIVMNANMRSPKKGDMLYTFGWFKNLYEGILFAVASNGITITSVEERKLVDLDVAMHMAGAAAENSIIDSLVKDVRYTADVMIAQNNNQDMLLQNGIFKGKKLFATMQTITDKEVNMFLKYIVARPRLYTGNAWKFSEIFATWMAGGTPTVVE